jgi:hypothetical protein
MGISGNGVISSHNNGATAPSSQKNQRAPRRLVLLEAEENSEVEQVLAEYQGAEISGKRLHTDLQNLAARNPGRCLAAEWLGPLGWTRFLWCRK